MPRILIIDDSVITRTQLRQFLESKGFEVIQAENGQAGLDAIEKHIPDCAITDLLMPKMNGLAFLQALQDRDISLPVLVITADIQDSTRETCKILNCIGVLNKPFNPTELMKSVDQMLATNPKDGS